MKREIYRKAWLVQIGEPLPVEKNVRTMRTAILADKLIENRYNVLWWTSAFDHFKKVWISEEDKELQLKEGLIIKTMKGLGYKKNMSFSRFLDHRILAGKFKKLASVMEKPDIIIVSLPTHDLAYQVVKFANDNDIPVVVDIRDPWPDIFFSHIPKKLRSFAKLFFYRDCKMVKQTMKMADGLIAVSTTFLEWGLKYAQREKKWNDKVLYLGYKKQSQVDLGSIKKEFIDLIKTIGEKYIIFFVGTISGSYHNPSIIVDAATKLADNKNIHFIIAGYGELFDELQSKAKGLDNLTMTGWLNQNEIEFFLRYANVGLCPATKAVELPSNKVYTYLSAGLPIISAFDGDIRNMIESENVGIHYTPDSLCHLVEAIETLYENKTLHKEMSENASEIFDRLFDAEIIYDQFVQHIAKIIDCKKS